MKKTDIYSFLFAEVALIVDWLYTGEEESLCLTDSNVVDILTTAHYLGLVHCTMSTTTFTTLIGHLPFPGFNTGNALVYLHIRQFDIKPLFNEVFTLSIKGLFRGEKE